MNWKRSGRKPSFSNCGTVHKFTGVTEETHENFNQDRRCTGRTSKRTPPEYKSTVLRDLEEKHCNVKSSGWSSPGVRNEIGHDIYFHAFQLTVHNHFHDS